MSKLTPQLNFKVNGKNWAVQHQNKFDLKIKATTPHAPAWFRITVVAKNKSAKTLLTNTNFFTLYQNHNTINAHLINESKEKAALVFLRHNPLNSLTLHWQHLPDGGDAPEFSIKVKTISAAKAWYYMLTQVSRQHAKQGSSRTYIYRISRARTKRAGINVALEKLVKEYQPQLAYQLISCEPYSFWREHKEPKLHTETGHNTQPVKVHFTLVIKGKADTQALLNTLHSVQQQNYANWQAWLCQQINLQEPSLNHFLNTEKRFNWQQDVPHATDSWFIFIEEGDQLAQNCLSQLANATSMQDLAIIYSDHDILNAEQKRVAPRLKPQWNPDLLMHQNYIGQAFAVKGQYLNFDTKNKGWLQHHYILLLSAIYQIPPQKRSNVIKHLPLMLFHQAQQNQKRGYNTATVKNLQQLYSKLAEQEGELLLKASQGKADNLFHLHYAIPAPHPLVTLIIPTRDALQITRTCVNSILFLTSYPHYEIIIVDNQSQQAETLTWFKQISQHPKVRILEYNKPFNYSAINNFAVTQAKGTVIGLINNDTEIINKDWLTEMLQHACRPNIGCVGAKLYYHDDTIQHAGVILGLWGLAGHSHKNYLRYEAGHQARLLSVQNLSAVTAACLLVRKAIYLEVGGLEEYHLTVAFNDVDFCLKVQQAGYRNIWTPYAELYHYESKTRGKEDTPAKKAREQREISYMQQKWASIIANDPAYNPHLTRSREDFTISIN